MSVLLVTLTTLTPIAFALLLGVLAGRTGWMKPGDNDILFRLSLDFCLPALLFVTSATMSVEQLSNWRFYLGIALGLLVTFLAMMAVSLTVFRKPVPAGSLQALNGSFPNMAAMGVPVLTSVLGASSVISVVMGNLISSFVLLPVTLTLLETGSAGKSNAGKSNAGKGDGANGSVVWTALLNAVKKPLVWAPVLGIVIAGIQIPIPDLVKKSFDLMGQGSSPVQLFAIGLLLSGQKFKVNRGAVLNITSKLLVQPAAMWGIAILLGVTGIFRREMILLGALPTASMIAAFAEQYNVDIDETDSTILLSTALSIVTLGIFVALTA